ncbi:nuclear transport factor 2 family protein [Hydrogenophaga palleronii]|uniref:nuclear transport factor 2 family protein n=1 Tax=Hydrogenophaga palleronii TaxID=65655 RepID=UPI00082597EB|nr:nuclear transport factor 2 family protein [Hydrogenophaga palleronii]
MPSTATLERFIELVESNAHDQAIEAFYAPHASMQENQDAPRVGREQLLAHERAVMARATSIRSQCVRPVFVNGDQVVLRWRFRFVWHDDSVTELEELAHQHWEGEQIVQEQFFYDPAQLTPQPPPGAAT